MSGDLIDTTEMYLKTVFELAECGTPPMRARIAERLGHSGPTVSQTVARMERDGLLHLGEGRVIELTEEGRALATSVMRKHRLAERHLLDVVGLDLSLVHEEACRWEHVMSLEVEKCLAKTLKAPYTDPFGNPIPALDALGVEAPKQEGDSTAMPLPDAVSDRGPVMVRLVRIGEWAQADEALLEDLVRQGALPGAHLEVRRHGDALAVRVDGAGEPIAVQEDIAGQLVVTPLAS